MGKKIPPEVQEAASMLEAKISALVDDFEQTHKPFQVNVVTRFRDHSDLYSVAKGGGAQLHLHNTSSMYGGSAGDGPFVTHDGISRDGKTHFTYTEEYKGWAEESTKSKKELGIATKSPERSEDLQ